MKPALERLVALQARDGELGRIEARLQALPARLAQARARVAAADAALEAHRERLKELGLARRAGEQEAEGLLAQERKFQGQQPLVKTNEELWALKREIEQVKAKRSEVETAVLQTMDEEEEGRRRTRELEGQAAEARRLLGQEQAAAAAEEAALAEEKAKVAAEREAIAGEIGPELRSRYERVRGGRGKQAVVPLVRGACGGCLTAQPPQRVQEVRQGELPVVCEFCGRLIVGIEGEVARPA